MTPEQLAKSNTEAGHQMALFCWAALNQHRFPQLRWLHAIPNGGARGDSARSSAIRGAQLKAQGVKAGVADIFLPVRSRLGLTECSGLYIEMKKPSERPVRVGSKGGVSAEQYAFGDFVSTQGYLWFVRYDWKEAADSIEFYLTNAY